MTSLAESLDSVGERIVDWALVGSPVTDAPVRGWPLARFSSAVAIAAADRLKQSGGYGLATLIQNTFPHLPVGCPMPAGGATFHVMRTMHYSGPNSTAEPRRAFILKFAVPGAAAPTDGPPDFGGVAARFSEHGRPNLVRGPPHLAAGRPWWRQGGPLTR